MAGVRCLWEADTRHDRAGPPPPAGRCPGVCLNEPGAQKQVQGWKGFEEIGPPDVDHTRSGHTCEAAPGGRGPFLKV